MNSRFATVRGRSTVPRIACQNRPLTNRSAPSCALVKPVAQNQVPVALVNLGKTRADGEGEIHVKVQADCGKTLSAVVEALSPGRLNPRHVSS